MKIQWKIDNTKIELNNYIYISYYVTETISKPKIHENRIESFLKLTTSL